MQQWVLRDCWGLSLARGWREPGKQLGLGSAFLLFQPAGRRGQLLRKQAAVLQTGRASNRPWGQHRCHREVWQRVHAANAVLLGERKAQRAGLTSELGCDSLSASERSEQGNNLQERKDCFELEQKAFRKGGGYKIIGECAADAISCFFE